MTFEVEWHERLSSTNAHMKEHFTQGLDLSNGTIFATREQTAGRGRSERKWLSAPDTNLCFSLFIKTSCALIEVPSLTMAIALAVTEMLKSHRIAATPKWPNDVLVGRKKICGILSERVERPDLSGIIVGIGLNVNMSTDEAESIDRPATSMLIESNKAFDLASTLHSLSSPITEWVNRWSAEGFMSIRDAWTQQAGPLGKSLSVHDGSVKKSGTLAGFGTHGELLLQTESGLETIWSGDVS